MVMLEWGPAAKLCRGSPTTPTAGRWPGRRGHLRRYVLYAPLVRCRGRNAFQPDRSVPTRSYSRPWEPAGSERGLASLLIGQVVNGLVRRGVRALEAFGRTAEAAELLDGETVEELRPAVAAFGDCSFEFCMIDAGFLQDASASRWRLRTGTSHGCVSNWTRAWAGRRR